MTSGNPTAVKELAYESALNELEALVADLDAGRADIDTLAQRFERAVEIVEELEGRIARTKDQVEKLAPRLEAVATKDAPTG